MCCAPVCFFAMCLFYDRGEPGDRGKREMAESTCAVMGFYRWPFLSMACFVFRERGRIIAEKVTCERKKTFDKT